MKKFWKALALVTTFAVCITLGYFMLQHITLLRVMLFVCGCYVSESVFGKYLAIYRHTIFLEHCLS